LLIKGERVYLGLMEESEAPYIHLWLNECEVRRLCFAECPLPVDMVKALEWIREMNGGPHSRLLSIKRIVEKDLIGFITVRKLSHISRGVRFGSLIWPPDLWSQGLGTEARKIFLDYAFNQLGFRRVFGDFAAYNEASRKSHEKLGAHISAQTKEASFVDGRYHDRFHYTYHREDYYQPYEPELANRSDAANNGFIWRDYDRLLQDYFNLPGVMTDDDRRATLKDKPHYIYDTGEACLLINDQRKNADMIFVPADYSELGRGLIRMICEDAFTQFNLHRLQVCIPSSAASWRQELLDEGFADEGRLDGVCFANDRYFDIFFLGKLRGR
jgi:RimJ/RimL family protein N-acetyltransferase